MENKSNYYHGGIYLKKTVDDMINQDLNITNFFNEISKNSKFSSENEDYEKFYVLNDNKEEKIFMITSTKYKYKRQALVLSIEDLNEKYIYLPDFLKKSEYIGKTWGIIDQNTDYVHSQPGIAYYKYNDRILVERKDTITDKVEITIVRKKAMQKFHFYGLTDEKYVDSKDMYTAISKQIVNDLSQLKKELDNDKKIY